MPDSRKGSFQLFRFAGIGVFLHWSWFFVAVLEISMRGRRYPSLAWNVAEYLALFLIVTLHEFGHALACRQVGGTANKIMLTRSHTLEHCRRPACKCCARWGLLCADYLGLAHWMEGYCASCVSAAVGCRLHESRPAHF